MSSSAGTGGGGGDGGGDGQPTIKQQKAALRKEVAARLKALEDGYIEEQVRVL